MVSIVYHNNVSIVNTIKNLINFLSNSSSSNFSVDFLLKRFIERITVRRNVFIWIKYTELSKILLCP